MAFSLKTPQPQLTLE